VEQDLLTYKQDKTDQQEASGDFLFIYDLLFNVHLIFIVKFKAETGSSSD